VNRHIPAVLVGVVLGTVCTPALAQSAPVQPAAAPPEVVGAPSPAAAPSAPPAAAPNAKLEEQVNLQRADLDEQDARIAELEKQLKDLKKAEAPKPEAKKDGVNAAPAAASTDFPLKVTGYVQSQYEFHQDSEDQLLQGGALLNQNRFLLRRVRVKLARDWHYGGVMVELDANTVKGPAIGLQHAEVSLAYRNADQSPLAQLTFGLFDNPFGREVVESPRERPFMERSFASREFFPAEPDLGLRLSGQAAWFRYSVAVVNGQPLGDRTGYILQDPNSHKDVLGRVGVDVTLPSAFRIVGGVSVLNGKGFHPGTDATKNTLVWRDNVSEDGLVQFPEVVGVAGIAAGPSKNFSRWLLGADLGAELVSKIGTTHLFGELSFGSNMDRNVFIADPTTNGFDEREFGYYVALYQELEVGHIAPDLDVQPVFGFRFDKYDPNSDFADARRGTLIPTTEAITTYSPMVGFQVPHKARLVAQWDIVRDALARNSVGVPVDKSNNVVTVRLQGEL
jgi:hypothetical protein